MKDAQKPDHVSLSTLVRRIKEGRFVIPDFQREFEWDPQDIRDLMRSIFLDYYIGSLLVWKSKPANFEALSCEPIYGLDGGDGSPEHIVLDGQQRLTAMHYVFCAPEVAAPNRSNRYLFFIDVTRFADEAYDEAFRYEWSRRGPDLLANEEAQWEQHMFPLAIIGRGGWDLPNWVQGYTGHWERRAEEADDEALAAECRLHVQNAEDFGSLLKEITEQYQISYIELDKDIPIDKVCDIFTQVNSKGVRLDVFDLINAMVRPKGVHLKKMWREASSRLAFAGTGRMNVYVLQVMSILRQTYCSPKYLYYLLPGQKKTVRSTDGTLEQEVLVPGSGDFEALWLEAVDSLEEAIETLRHPQEFGAISAQYFPYESILPAFAALHRMAASLPANERLIARRKIAHWYWASVFTNRYSGSVESTTARDYLDLQRWFADDSAEPALFNEFKVRCRELELRHEVKRGTSVYNGVFNLLVINGARDWLSGGVQQSGDLDDHHIVPKDWSKEHDLTTSIDTILNRAPLTSESNRHVINNRLPNVYLPELIVTNGEGMVRETLESHFISPAAFDILLREPFAPEDFEEFVSERQRTILAAIEDLLIKERLDLEPQLRELDVKVEDIELRIRNLIDDRLEGDPGTVPEHVRQKVDGRISTAAKKAPGGKPQDALAFQLEYFDLRELQEAIVSKGLWPRFEDTFGSKEMLANRFDQLGELRNSIRHNRSVTEVARRDGEAAIVWFDEALLAPTGGSGS